MKRIMNSTMKRITVRGLWGAACVISLSMQPFTASTALAVPTVPLLWSAGGQSAGGDSAGQSARIASDASGNIAVVSGPGFYTALVVTSYTANGIFRWRSTITPALGTFVGDWVVAAPNGDFIAIGHNQDSHGRPIQSTMVRYDTNGTLLWRVDFSSGFYPAVGRLVADSAGSAYLTWNSVGNGLFVQKYSPSGALLWSQGSSNGGPYAIATSLALSPDETDVVATGDVSGGATWLTAAFDTTTGAPRWEVAAPEGIANLDVVVDSARVYVTGEGNIGTSAFLTVVAYDRATGTRLWRTDANPPTGLAYGTRIALAPDSSLAVAGRTSTGGYFDWWIVSLNTNGAIRWQARRDEALSGDEVPAAVFVLADGTTVVSGTGGPVIHDILGNSYMVGVTAGYSPNGTLLWEAFSTLPTAWATALPNGDVCATGGYDAFTTCWGVSAGVVNPPQPTSVVSRKTHGTAGAFDINLPLAGNAGIECRSGGANSDHQVVFTFLTAVTLSGATVTPEPGRSGTLAGPPVISPDGRTVTLNLTDVTDAQTIAMTLVGVNNGTSTGDITAHMSLLIGDTNVNGVVNASDISQTKSRSGQAISNVNFRSDVVVNGVINASDLALVKSRSGAGAFVIGQHYGGGIIFWIDDSRQHGLIAAESDQGFNWWGDRFYLVTGATGTAVGTGAVNTGRIIKTQGLQYTYAALLCVDYRGGGFADWFLPSKDELYLLYLQKDVVGGFIRGAYWSSSESDVDHTVAWTKFFYNNDAVVSHKDRFDGVRAIRAF